MEIVFIYLFFSFAAWKAAKCTTGRRWCGVEPLTRFFSHLPHATTSHVHSHVQEHIVTLQLKKIYSIQYAHDDDDGIIRIG